AVSFLVPQAAFVSQSVPAVMRPGRTYQVSLTMRNSGSVPRSPPEGFRPRAPGRGLPARVAGAAGQHDVERRTRGTAGDRPAGTTGGHDVQRDRAGAAGRVCVPVADAAGAGVLVRRAHAASRRGGSRD